MQIADDSSISHPHSQFSKGDPIEGMEIRNLLELSKHSPRSSLWFHHSKKRMGPQNNKWVTTNRNVMFQKKTTIKHAIKQAIRITVKTTGNSWRHFVFKSSSLFANHILSKFWCQPLKLLCSVFVLWQSSELEIADILTMYSLRSTVWLISLKNIRTPPSSLLRKCLLKDEKPLPNRVFDPRRLPGCLSRSSHNKWDSGAFASFSPSRSDNVANDLKITARSSYCYAHKGCAVRTYYILWCYGAIIPREDSLERAGRRTVEHFFVMCLSYHSTPNFSDNARPKPTIV